jgi:hypothetical protein
MKRCSAVTAKGWSQIRRQVYGERAGADVTPRAEFGPMGGGHRRATIVASAAYRLEFQAAGAVIVQRLPHATGMWRGNGDRQSHRGKDAHEQQYKQQSGGQAMHDFVVSQTSPPKDRLPGPAVQALGGYVGVLRLPGGKSMGV